MRVFVLFATLIMLSLSQAFGAIRELPLVTVVASSSLSIPLSQLIRRYSAEHQVTINVAYGSSFLLAKKIQDGNSADIIISSSPEAITMLQQDGLIRDNVIAPLFTNKLVLAIAQDSPLLRDIEIGKPMKEILANVTNRSILVIGDPDMSPLGKYTKEALQKLGIWRKVEPMAIRAANSRIALYLIAQGKTAGICYYTDTVNNPEVKRIAEFPEGLHSVIQYQAAVVINPAAVEKEVTLFFNYLESEEAMAVFRYYGFKESGI